jgi:beta-1,4-mannooligosaccharide/beta-1,4-mannosyl-N-acetylglucosamine phosphorylase
MAKVKIIGPELPDMPWEPCPQDCNHVVWRYSRNPVIPRDLIPCSNSIFNSAVVPFDGGYAGVFRCDDKRRRMRIHAGRSDDGINWEIEPEPIDFVVPDPELKEHHWRYDPRVCQIDDTYYVTWCNWYHGPTIGLASTKDFKTFHQMENMLLPYNRNGVMFPRQINGKYYLLSRPSDTRHTSFGDIFCSESPDLLYWGKHRFVMGTKSGWQCTKVGAGPVPIETSEGWLMIYHGVLTSCNGYVYSAGAALLDLDEPWKVTHRAGPYLWCPETLYECVGDVPNVVFPCAALADSTTGRIAIYYGAADTVTAVAFAEIDTLVDFIKETSEL